MSEPLVPTEVQTILRPDQMPFVRQEECFLATVHLEQQVAHPPPATHYFEALASCSSEEDF